MAKFTFGELADQLVSKMDIEQGVDKERVKAVLVKMMADRNLLNMVEQGRYKIVKTGKSWAWSLLP